MSDLTYRTAVQLADAVRRGEMSAKVVVEAHLRRIREANGVLNAVVAVDAEGALREARRADVAAVRGERLGPLHGVPVTIKDVFETAGLRTSASHQPLREHVPDRDATVVARLRAAGAIVLGKTHTPELALDTQCESRLHGRTCNPWDLERTPGGSSGGDAAAVAAGMTPLGLGSDIGGSVRLPAHYCGVCGLKPTEGLVPMSGHIPPLPGETNWIRHLAAPGPLARSVADLRLCLGLLAGPDGLDRRVTPIALGTAARRDTSGLRIAWTDELAGLPVSRDTRASLRKLADDLSDAGCQVTAAAPRNFDLEDCWQAYGELVGAMMAAHLPLPSRALVWALGPVLFRRDPIGRAMGTRLMASRRTYCEILKRRDDLTRALETFLTDYDVWICPTAATCAPPHRRMGKINTPIAVDDGTVPGHVGAIGYTCPFNLTGHPVVAIPIAPTEDGLPIGAQLVGRLWDDAGLLDVAELVSGVARGLRRPPGVC